LHLVGFIIRNLSRCSATWSLYWFSRRRIVKTILCWESCNKIWLVS